MMIYFLSQVDTMLNMPYSWDMQPSDGIFSQITTHTMGEVI
jgi:hypothetical protein